MEDREFKALISLLDDEDPEVSEHVWSQLIAMGRDGMDRLEAEWEVQMDSGIQRKIEEVIQRITLKGVGEELLKWRKGGGKDLLEGWFLVTRYQYPDLNFTQYKNEINRLVNKTWLEINNRMEPWDKVRVINHILFVMEGYGPNREKSNEPRNNYINFTMEQHTGNPITLGMLYMVIAQKLDFPVYGVLLPGYFVLMYLEEDKEFFIDVFNGGRTFSKNDLKRFLKEMKVAENPSFYKPTSNIYIILSLIRTLAADYRNNGQEEKAADLEQLLKDIEIKFD